MITIKSIKVLKSLGDVREVAWSYGCEEFVTWVDSNDPNFNQLAMAIGRVAVNKATVLQEFQLGQIPV